ncbi:hypothetical protein BDW02DRAFT_314987 [Decorospora gaudefroyi]|uniref:Indole-diterpene biosynthesis protein-like protein PaxU n=1 Tax=Decorospora gaudefroyi TaxID=184978 RepID=A0A6A5KGF9_9PLEO|nr:hypothetical protein BDW02DRAFT_314987 [Decorospora gaudefroyi]
MDPPIVPAPDQTTQPLSDFQKIGHNTYIWTSSSYLTQPAKETPLILLFAWNAAASKHISKYTLSYQKLFPASRILLVRCYTPDMFRSTGTYERMLQPALNLVAEHTTADGEILVHSFSNGGGNQVNEFAKAWKKIHGSKLLPMRAQILDSSPTKGPWMQSHAAIAASLPKTAFWAWFGGPLVHLLLLCTWLADKIMWRESRMVRICRELNDEKVFDTRVPRVYLYSRADMMVGFEEADEHADIARAKGWHVAKVQFEKSMHCGHVREDEEKYWAAVLQAWKRGPSEG